MPVSNIPELSSAIPQLCRVNPMLEPVVGALAAPRLGEWRCVHPRWGCGGELGVPEFLEDDRRREKGWVVEPSHLPQLSRQRGPAAGRARAASALATIFALRGTAVAQVWRLEAAPARWVGYVPRERGHQDRLLSCQRSLVVSPYAPQQHLALSAPCTVPRLPQQWRPQPPWPQPAPSTGSRACARASPRDALLCCGRRDTLLSINAGGRKWCAPAVTHRPSYMAAIPPQRLVTRVRHPARPRAATATERARFPGPHLPSHLGADGFRTYPPPRPHAQRPHRPLGAWPDRRRRGGKAQRPRAVAVLPADRGRPASADARPAQSGRTVAAWPPHRRRGESRSPPIEGCVSRRGVCRGGHPPLPACPTSVATRSGRRPPVVTPPTDVDAVRSPATRRGTTVRLYGGHPARRRRAATRRGGPPPPRLRRRR